MRGMKRESKELLVWVVILDLAFVGLVAALGLLVYWLAA